MSDSSDSGPRVSVVVPLQRQPFEEVVACLREKLAQAERGEITAFAYVCEYHNGNVGQYAFHDKGSNIYKLVGVIEALKARLVKRYLGSSDDSENLD